MTAEPGSGGISRLDEMDVRWTLRLLPKQLRALLQETGAILGGGFIRAAIANEKASDIDIFAANPALAESVAKKVCALSPGAKLIRTQNAFTAAGAFRLSVQVIHRWTFPDAHSLIESFDFTISRAAIWWNGTAWDSECDPGFYPDLAGRRLVYCKPKRNEDAGGSMLRVLKFYQRGYRIPLDSLGDVVARLMESVDEGRLRGVAGLTHEDKVGRAVTALLVAVDPNLDVGAVAHLPGRGETIEGADEPEEIT